MRLPTTCFAVDQTTLIALLIKAGVYSVQEASLVLNEGYKVSMIPSQPDDDFVSAAVRAPSEEAYALINQTFKDNINIGNQPVRIFLGEAMPEPSIDALQIRLALNDLGLRAAVEGAVAAASQEIKDWWAEAPRFLKSDPMVQAMATQLGVSAEQLDGIWALGATK